MEDDFIFFTNGGGQSGHPKSGSSWAQGGFKGDKKRKWEKLPHKHKEFQEKNNLKKVEQDEMLQLWVVGSHDKILPHTHEGKAKFART
jgi:hypothetical protein